MRQFLILLTLIISANVVMAQPAINKLKIAIESFERDPQLKYAAIGLSVMELGSGKMAIEKNGGMGLAPASCLKVLTSASAFALLGKSYQYTTEVLVDNIENGEVKGNIYILGSSDPTLGSWRFPNISDSAILKRFKSEMKGKGINAVSGDLVIYSGALGSDNIPDGYIWQDMGNYFGSTMSGFNWRENQYDITFKMGKEGSLSSIAGFKPIAPPGIEFINEITAGPSGSGDNAFIYSAPGAKRAFLKGTLPAERSSFSISGSVHNPSLFFGEWMKKNFNEAGINLAGSVKDVEKIDLPLISTKGYKPFFSIQSPPLTEIVYHFNRRSINLYGEALLRTIGKETGKDGSYKSGIKQVQEFWKTKGIEPEELRIWDGSGLSPLNRVTTNSLVKVMAFANKQDWWKEYFESFPEFNGIKMKSGTISGVKGYTGYIRSSDGNEYLFSFIVNNYSGSASSLVQKMYKVLDSLK